MTYTDKELFLTVSWVKVRISAAWRSSNAPIVVPPMLSFSVV
jgi:hypothetical protein